MQNKLLRAALRFNEHKYTTLNFFFPVWNQIERDCEFTFEFFFKCSNFSPGTDASYLWRHTCITASWQFRLLRALVLYCTSKYCIGYSSVDCRVDECFYCTTVSLLIGSRVFGSRNINNSGITAELIISTAISFYLYFCILLCCVASTSNRD